MSLYKTKFEAQSVCDSCNKVVCIAGLRTQILLKLDHDQSLLRTWSGVSDLWTNASRAFGIEKLDNPSGRWSGAARAARVDRAVKVFIKSN